MSQECSLCKRHDRHAIDAAILCGEYSMRDMASRFETSTATIARHREHIPRQIVAAREAVVVADTLLGKVRNLEQIAIRIGTAAESDGDLRTALMSVDKLVRIVELMGKLNGELQNQQAQVNVAVQLTTEQRLVVDLGLTEPELRQLHGEKLLTLDEKRAMALAIVEELDRQIAERDAGNGAKVFDSPSDA